LSAPQVASRARIADLKPRLEAHPEAVGGTAGLDGAECDAFDHRRQLAELVGGIDLELEPAAGTGFDAGLQRLVVFVHDVVDGRRRQLHGELLRARAGHRETTGGRNDHSEPTKHDTHSRFLPGARDDRGL
jgi:hypothetical protein